MTAEERMWLAGTALFGLVFLAGCLLLGLR